MVLDRLQTSKINQLESVDMDYFSDNDSEASFPERKPRGVSNNVEKANLLDLERDHERIRNDQKFMEMNN